MPEMNELLKQTNEAVDVLRKSAEKYGEDSAEFKSALEKTDAQLQDFDKKNQELVAEVADAQKKAVEAEERLVNVEKKLLEVDRSGESVVQYKNSPQYKALASWAVNGIEGIGREEKALLRGDDSTQGGYLTMPEMDSMILKNITEVSPVRQFARVKTVGSKTLTIPKRTSIPTALYEGEADQDDESTSEYGSESLTCYALSTTVPFTRDVMMDAQFDLESEIRMDVAEAFAFAEGRNFVLGDSAKKPEGILTNADLIAGARTSESSGVLGFDDLRLMTGDLKVGYNPVYFFNRKTKANLLIQKGSDGQYLWSIGRDGAPATLNGYTYTLFEDMPDVAANAYAVGFGDLARGYCITDFSGMEIVRDEVTRKRNRIIELTFFRWNTGQVVLSEAIQLCKIKA